VRVGYKTFAGWIWATGCAFLIEQDIRILLRCMCKAVH